MQLISGATYVCSDTSSRSAHWYIFAVAGQLCTMKLTFCLGVDNLKRNVVTKGKAHGSYISLTGDNSPKSGEGKQVLPGVKPVSAVHFANSSWVAGSAEFA